MPMPIPHFFKKITALFGIDEDRWDDPPIWKPTPVRQECQACNQRSQRATPRAVPSGTRNVGRHGAERCLDDTGGSRIADMSRHIIPSGYVKIAIENGHLYWIFPLNIVMFHSYVSLPEGICFTGMSYSLHLCKKQVDCTYLAIV